MAVALAGAMATGTWAAAHEGGAKTTITPASDSSSTVTGDDHGGLRPPGVSDDPAGHDAGDDHGGLRPPGVSDDPPGHDANDPDRRGGDNSGPGSGDSDSDNSGPGSADGVDNSGPGSVNSGDDGGHHDGDDGGHDG